MPAGRRTPGWPTRRLTSNSMAYSTWSFSLAITQLLLLFCPSSSCTIIYRIIRFTRTFHLLEFQQKIFDAMCISFSILDRDRQALKIMHIVLMGWSLLPNAL